jgi:hypothetical protein
VKGASGPRAAGSSRIATRVMPRLSVRVSTRAMAGTVRPSVVTVVATSSGYGPYGSVSGFQSQVPWGTAVDR